jgi:putative nucleotidyltransferase with HDIG domain
MADVPLKKKLIRISLFSTVIALIVASALLMYGEFISAKNSLVEELAALADSTASSSTAAITFQDKKSAEEILGALNGMPYIESATVYLRDGTTFASYVRKGTKEDYSFAPTLERRYYLRGGKITYFQPVMLQGEKIGTISLRSSLKGFYRHMTFHALVLLLAITVSIFIAYFTISKLQKTVTQPIISLSNLMDSISRDRDYSRRALKGANDEVGHLIGGFNEMLTQIQERDLELEIHRKHLEELVTERTSELSLAYEKLEQSLDEIVETMAIIVEAKDPYTAGHQKRVAKLASTMAAEMALDIGTRKAVHIASLLHDIGKIQVPSEILSKGKKLSGTEFSLIKAHAQWGYDILRGIHFPHPVADIILQHHERLDGSGYPSGLQATETLLEAKILAVADIVEAMLSHRPYRPALTLDEALQELAQNRGRLYDSAIVDVCLKLFREKGFVFE